MNTLELKYEKRDEQYIPVYVYNGRFTKWSPFVEDTFKDLPDNQCICHIISFHTIAAGIQNALNLYLELVRNRAPYALNVCIGYIVGMICSVYRIPCDEIVQNICDDPDHKLCYIIELGQQFVSTDTKSVLNIGETEIPELISILCNIIEVSKNGIGHTELGNEVVLIYMGNQCCKIIDILNNAIENLRCGYRGTNSSVSDAFDCCGYVVSEEDGFILTDAEDNIAITNLLYLTTPDLNNNSAVFFYTATHECEPFLYTSIDERVVKVTDVEVCEKNILFCNYANKEFKPIGG